MTGDILVPGDYDGDGKTDLAVWWPTTGEWFRSLSGVIDTQQWGQAGDIPVSNALRLPPSPPPPPQGQLIVTVVPSAISLDAPVQITVTVVDSLTGQAVPGSQVIVANYTARQGNLGGDPVIVRQPGGGVPFIGTITFHRGRETDPETKTSLFDLDPVIRAIAPNYVDGDASPSFT